MDGALRDLVTTILETNLTIQGNRLNVIIKKVTGWAGDHRGADGRHRVLRDERALSGLRRLAGFVASIAVMVVAAGVLYVVFKRKDWL